MANITGVGGEPSTSSQSRSACSGPADEGRPRHFWVIRLAIKASGIRHLGGAPNRDDLVMMGSPAVIGELIVSRSPRLGQPQG